MNIGMNRAVPVLQTFLFVPLSCRNSIVKRSEGLQSSNVEKWETKTIQYAGKGMAKEMSQHYYLERIIMPHIIYFSLSSATGSG